MSTHNPKSEEKNKQDCKKKSSFADSSDRLITNASQNVRGIHLVGKHVNNEKIRKDGRLAIIIYLVSAP